MQIEIGKVYKPSEVSFEDKDTRIEVYQVGMGRVCPNCAKELLGSENR